MGSSTVGKSWSGGWDSWLLASGSKMSSTNGAIDDGPRLESFVAPVVVPSTPLVIIPARVGSKGIPNKNFRLLAGVSPLDRAIRVVREAGLEPLVSTDAKGLKIDAEVLYAPAPLHTDICPMIDVVNHAMALRPGNPVLLVQPSQPLRQAKHLRLALTLLTPIWDSVVSVTEVPRSHHAIFQMEVTDLGHLRRQGDGFAFPATRQSVPPLYVRDGTVYAFWRTRGEPQSLYGERVLPLIIAPEETCALDTPLDWLVAEARLATVV